MTRYHFFGHPCPDAVAARLADRMVLFDTRFGSHVVRQRTAQYVGVPRQPKAVAS